MTTSRKESQQNSVLENRDFLNEIRDVLWTGGAVTPFVGSGISAPSGVLMGDRFDDYLGYVVDRIVGNVRHPWDLRRRGWPRYPNRKEVEKAKCSLREEYRNIVSSRYACEIHAPDLLISDVYEKRMEGNNGPSRERGAGQSTVAATTHFRRPLIPEFLSTSECCRRERRLAALREQLRIRDEPNDPNDSPSSRTIIIEKALRSMSHWTRTLEFLSAICVDHRGALYLDEPESYVIDSFNAHITRGKRPNLIHNMISQLSRSFRSQLILTTNFDQLIEQSFRRLNEPLHTLAVSINGSLPAFSTTRAQMSLVKLHGDILETRADASINEPPSTQDKARVFNYLRGPEAHQSSQPEDFGKSELLVIGYSANDARCVQMIKFVLDHDPDFRVFWVCYSTSDLEWIGTVFAEYLTEETRNGKRRFLVTDTKRCDLLLWELYQVVNLSLPPGGFTFQFSHNVPPEPARSANEDHEALQRMTANLVAELGIGGGKHPPNTRPLDHLTKHCNRVNPCAIDAPTGVAVPAKAVFEQFQEKGLESIWVELEDYISPIHLTFQLLEIITLRIGTFQLEWTNLMPRDIWEWNYVKTYRSSSATAERDRKRMLNEIKSHLRLLIDHISIEPSKWALFLYGRNGPGGCVGLNLNYWKKEDYALLNDLLDVLTSDRLGFNVVHLAYGPKRQSRNLEKVAWLEEQLKERQKHQGFITGDLRKRYREWLSEEYSHLSEPNRKVLNPLLVPNIKKDNHPKNPSGEYDSIVNKVLNWFENTHSEIDDELDRYRAVWLYGITLFRKSRHSAALMSEAVFPCPRRFNWDSPAQPGSLEHDNDRLRNNCLFGEWRHDGDLHSDRGQTTGWVGTLAEMGILLRKPGGYTWKYRDTRLGLQYILEHYRDVHVGHNRSVETLWHIRPRLHLWIADWYMRAFFATGHYSPLVESIYHSFNALRLSRYYVPAHPGSIEDRRPDLVLLARTRLAWCAANQLQMALNLGRNSLQFWCSGIDLKQTLFALPECGIDDALRDIANDFSSRNSGSKVNQVYGGEFLLDRLEHLVRVSLPRSIEKLNIEVLSEGGAHLASTPPTVSAPSFEEEFDLEGENVAHESSEIAKSDWIKGRFHELFCMLGDDAFDFKELMRLLNATKRNSRELNSLSQIASDWEKVQLKRWIDSGASERSLTLLIWILLEMAYRHIRRAKMERHAQGANWFCAELTDYSKNQRHLWGRASCLLYVSLDLCRYLTVDSLETTLTLRVRALILYGLCLGRLGRYCEAHRRLNEAHALLSHGTEHFDNKELGKIHLRRAEICLLQASDQVTRLHEFYNDRSLTATQRASLKEPEGRLAISYVDDSWASLERAEEVLSGLSHATLWWSRLNALKLNCYAVLGRMNKYWSIFKRDQKSRRSCLPFRRRLDYPMEIIRLLRGAFTLGTGDQYRRLRAFHYFCGACQLADTELPKLKDILKSWESSSKRQHTNFDLLEQVRNLSVVRTRKQKGTKDLLDKYRDHIDKEVDNALKALNKFEEERSRNTEVE